MNGEKDKLDITALKKMMQTRLILIFMLLPAIGGGSFLLAESSSKPKSMIRFFSPGSFYIYVMGSYNHFSPDEEYFPEFGPESADAFAPVLGMGCRLVNIEEWFFINLEGDYSPAVHNFADYARGRKIHTFTFMLNAEGKVSSKKIPILLYTGLGIGFHRSFDQGDQYLPGDDTITVLAFDFGIKIQISRRFFIRSECQWNGQVYGDYSYDEYDYLDDTRWNFLSFSFSTGLEIHL